MESDTLSVAESRIADAKAKARPGLFPLFHSRRFLILSLHHPRMK